MVAVTTPVATIPPAEFIPTPSWKLPKVLFPPICNVNLGSLVDIPTNPVLYILVNPKPTSISTHCDSDIPVSADPSPTNLVAVKSPVVASAIIALPTSILLNVAIPTDLIFSVSILVTVNSPTILDCPLTSKNCSGTVVPIPTFPSESTTKLSSST